MRCPDCRTGQMLAGPLAYGGFPTYFCDTCGSSYEARYPITEGYIMDPNESKPIDRPSRAELHMLTAMMWAQRSLCAIPGRKVGAVITTADMKQILSIGYCGPGSGLPDDNCLRTRNLIDDAQGSRCTCLHAEDNAIAGVNGTILNKVLFTTLSPCFMCAQRILRSNITMVYYLRAYRNTAGVDALVNRGVQVTAMPSLMYELNVLSVGDQIDKGLGRLSSLQNLKGVLSP